MTSELTNQVTVSLLVLWLVTVLSIGTVVTLALVSYIKGVRISEPAKQAPSIPEPRVCVPTLFDQAEGCRWVAIRSSNVAAVQAALGLNNPTPCSWSEGVTVGVNHRLFISPPVDGWILVLGSALPDPLDDIDDVFAFLAHLSQEIGRVHFFSANRAINHHGWAWLEKGRVVRAYFWSGETTWNQGAKTHAESQLGLRCFDYGEELDILSPERESYYANTEKVTQLAARWSFDPIAVDEKALATSQGVVGDLSPHRW